jgi:hypothetical protein
MSAAEEGDPVNLARSLRTGVVAASVEAPSSATNSRRLMSTSEMSNGARLLTDPKAKDLTEVAASAVADIVTGAARSLLPASIPLTASSG